MTELAFPEIEEAAAAVSVVNPPAAPDLAKVDLEAVALAQFGDWRADVAQVRNNLSTLALDLTTQAKVDEAKSLRHRLINQPRADVRKVSKALKSKLTAVSKAVGALEDAAVAAYDKAEELITPQIDKRQGELDAEREEKARVERERVAAIQAKLDGLQSWVTRCHEEGMTAARIKAGMLSLNMLDLPKEEWQEFQGRALVRRAEVVAEMQIIFERRLIAEAEAQRLEEQRAEAARIKALLDERQRALDAQAAELKRQAEELDAAQRKARCVTDQFCQEAVICAPGACARAKAEQERRSQEAIDAAKAMAAALQPGTTEGQDSQQVLKAEPAIYSGGPFGAANSLRFADDGEDFGVIAIDAAEPRDQTPAEIAAANGPEVDLPPLNPGDFLVVNPQPLEDDEDEGSIDALLLDCINLIDVLRQPFAGRFPGQPKQGPEWWADVRWRIENLGPRLLMAAAAKKAGL